ncbi:hypothetical protein A2U04_00795 [Fusobacterium necrophorum subsp. funduliforme]|uniref:hypothetical protein n=1 Tax=Fusobacterium necrophorum TaxID=859 RepID=UPI00061D862A|nr:hypothetical protein [Fusobacterium necrophorum]KYM50912.1 hypothetical protein A2U04_00795 [Fusobacterium necrophorum subsp. funduliforme]
MRKYIEYFIPVLISFVTYFSNKYLPDISRFFSIIPLEEKNNFNIIFYFAVFTIFFQFLIDLLTQIWNKIKISIIIIIYEKNKTPNIDNTPEITFNSKDLSEVYFNFKIKGNSRILKKIILDLDLPNWASFQANIKYNQKGCYEISIKDVIHREKQNKYVEMESNKSYPIIFNPTDDETNSDKVSISIKNRFLRYLCEFHSNSFIIKNLKR